MFRSPDRAGKSPRVWCTSGTLSPRVATCSSPVDSEDCQLVVYSPLPVRIPIALDVTMLQFCLVLIKSVRVRD